MAVFICVPTRKRGNKAVAGCFSYFPTDIAVEWLVTACLHSHLRCTGWLTVNWGTRLSNAQTLAGFPVCLARTIKHAPSCITCNSLGDLPAPTFFFTRHEHGGAAPNIACLLVFLPGFLCHISLAPPPETRTTRCNGIFRAGRRPPSSQLFSVHPSCSYETAPKKRRNEETVCACGMLRILGGREGKILRKRNGGGRRK